MIKQCQNLPPELCWAGLQTVKPVSEPSSWALLGKGAGCLSDVRTYLQGTVGQGCRLLKRCGNLPPGHCGAGMRLFKQCRNLLPGHCGAGVHAG